MPDPATRHLTILLTDIKGFTDKTSHKSRADIAAMLDEHRAVVLPILERRGGRLVKTIGDAFLMTFESPTNAALAGAQVQAALAARNEGRAPDDLLEIRIAINAGEVNVIGRDVFGEAVNITARVEGVTEAGQVYVTEAVYLAMNKIEVPSSEVGLVQLKGIPEKIRVYRVRLEDVPAAATAPAPARASGLSAVSSALAAFPRRRAAALALDLLLCALLTGGLVGRGFVVQRPVEKKVELPPPSPDAGIGGRFLERIGLHGRKKYAAAAPRAKKPAPRPWGRAALCLALVALAYHLLFLGLLGATPGELALEPKGARRPRRTLFAPAHEAP
ncbi:MAG TPA: adenylate/guanylate cyclase domain-containing protein [Elusimicrobiota bacterium]|jgi:class 3 adenylate cyclase|nr:adenylate/guanylate cyclase domain-containing protein [Elusimicrobiota bacterium]